MIEVVGPDHSSFQFPDGTPEATITEALAQHYGAPPANEGFDRNDPALKNQDTRALLRGVPVVGPLVANKLSAGVRTVFNGGKYAENLQQEDAAQKAFEAEHPVLDTVSQGIGGTLALGGFGGLVPQAARALGMTGKLLPAMRNAALSGAAIGGADAAARGNDVSEGALAGGLTGPAGVLVGKGVGKAYDAAVRGLRGAPAVPTRTMDVNGTPVPIRESMETGNPDTSRTEQTLLKSGQPAALQGEEAAQAAMARAHSDLSANLDPTTTSPGATPLEAGDAVARDLVSREQQRAATEVARTQAAIDQTAGIHSEMDAPPFAPAPQAPQEAGQSLSDRIQSMFQTARGATRAAYDVTGQTPGEFNPRHLLGAGEDIRLRLNSAPGNERVRISPEVTPTAQAALQTVDSEIAQLNFTNDAARGSRPITPADMEQVRKQLVILRRQANNAARTTGNWEDARAMGRVMEEFNSWLARTARRPGAFSGDAEQYLRTQEAARTAHATERATFSRRGPGDQVGAMMEGIIGKYPGQQMSPDKIIRTLLGSPDNPGGSEHAVAVLNHLRDGLGTASPEWAALKKAAISHFTEPAPGGEAVPLTKQAERVLRFLGNERHAGAVFTPEERARLSLHAQRLASAEDALPIRGTVEQKIAILSGRITGEPATGANVVAQLMAPGAQDSAKLARAVRDHVSPQSWALVKQGLWKMISAAPEGRTAWGDQKTGESIAKFLNTELAREVFSANERMLMKVIGDAHHRLVPIPGTTNPSGTAHTAAKLVAGARHQLLALFGFAHGGLPGAGIALALGKALDWSINKRAANQATKLFLGPQPKASSSTGAQRALVTAAQTPALRQSR